MPRTTSSTCWSRSKPGGTWWSGSRRHDDTTTLVRARRLREVGGRAINLLTRVVLLGRYRDTQCGLKAFRSDLGRLIFEHSHIDGFAFDVEIFHLVEAYQLSLAEVPVRVENSSRSTVRVARDAAADGPRHVCRAALVEPGRLRPGPRRGGSRRPPAVRRPAP